jgi:basic amino acid/polyamine antiporter, APA family
MKKLWRKKSVADLQAETRADSGLKRALGAIDLTAIGIGTIIGAGIFVLTGQAAANYAGPAIVFSFVLAAFAVVCAAVLVLRYREPDLPRPFKTPWVPLVPLLGIACCLYLALSLPFEAWLRLFFWLIIGLVIYFLYGVRHSRLGLK